MAKRKKERIDGRITPDDVTAIRNAIRQIWQWTSVARKTCLKRALLPNGFSKCELCGEIVPKVYADHRKVMGSILAPDYIVRMWCGSDQLDALCKKCHDRKTREERKAEAALIEIDWWTGKPL